MATTKSKIIKESPSLSLATNGFILKWSEYSVDKSSQYGGRNYLGGQEKVFKLNEKEEAMNAFIELGKECGYNIEDESSSEDAGENGEE